MNTKIEEVETIISHPMEAILDIEAGTTLLPHTQRTTELIEIEEYDKKDVEIENQFQEVYDAAMGAFDDQMEEVELVEGKYKARNGEIAVQFLNAALAAVKEKSTLKMGKDKLEVSRGKMGPKTLNQNVIVADRNDLLKEIFGKRPEMSPIKK
jgi:hypothetical protein